MMSVNTQKSSLLQSVSIDTIAGEIHRQILIRGVPSDEEMSGYRRNPECLRGAQGDLNYKCLWLMAWQKIMRGHSIPCLDTAIVARHRRCRDANMACSRRCFAARTRLGSFRPPAIQPTSMPDGAKHAHHPGAGRAPIALSENSNSNKSRY